ncbi:uncharacterized protein L203_105151 [Cryptococcus depauperatus CBS 7841]|uniref:tRNA (uracil-O(2)-)-methyltransferase n=1 Tax=Cryptococcus depauperatus CBS 7841 TaxID=1295531 RepID=A0AAJ8JWY5_9TREE
MPVIDNLQNPYFHPTFYHTSVPSILSRKDEQWVGLASAPCYFSVEVFFSSLKDVYLHPERWLRGSRAEVVGMRSTRGVEEVVMDGIGGMRLELVDRMLVRLQPGRDKRMKQTCLFYKSTASHSDMDKGLGRETGFVVIVPEARTAGDFPRSYPPVSKLAYLWEPWEMDSSNGYDGQQAELLGTQGGSPLGRISIHYLALSRDRSFAGSQQSESRPMAWHPAVQTSLYRPVRSSPLAGALNNDQVQTEASFGGQLKDESSLRKDILDKCLALLENLYKHGHAQLMAIQHSGVPSFQALYLKLKDRHRHINPQQSKPRLPRHALQAYDLVKPDGHVIPDDISDWGQHDIAVAAYLMLLWKDMYSAERLPNTGEAVEEREWDNWGKPERGFVDVGCPWLPLLSLIPQAPVPYLSLPCCLHNLDSPFSLLDFEPPSHPHAPVQGYDANLDEQKGLYKSYLIWLGWIGVNCGWDWKAERIRGELKGWGIVARNRWPGAKDDIECRIWALREVMIIEDVNMLKRRYSYPCFNNIPSIQPFSLFFLSYPILNSPYRF